MGSSLDLRRVIGLSSVTRPMPVCSAICDIVTERLPGASAFIIAPRVAAARSSTASTVRDEARPDRASFGAPRPARWAQRRVASRCSSEPRRYGRSFPRAAYTAAIRRPSVPAPAMATGRQSMWLEWCTASLLLRRIGRLNLLACVGQALSRLAWARGQRGRQFATKSGSSRRVPCRRHPAMRPFSFELAADTLASPKGHR